MHISIANLSRAFGGLGAPAPAIAPGKRTVDMSDEEMEQFRVMLKGVESEVGTIR